MIALPSGWTFTSFAVKSVSGADEDTKTVSDTGPVTSTGSVSTPLSKHRTSSRWCTGRWSAAPSNELNLMSVPPNEGTGRRGSYR